MKLEGIEVEVWEHNRVDCVEFYLRWRGVTLCIWPREGRSCGKWKCGHWTITPARRAYGNRSNPLSFLTIVGHCVEEVWRLGQRIQVTGQAVILGG